MPKGVDRRKAREGPDNDDWDEEAEMGGGGGDQSPFMRQFFAKVSEVKKDMETIKRNMATMDKKHGAALTAVSSSASTKRQEELEGLMDSTNAMIKGVKDTLHQMDAESKEYAAKNKGKGDSESRIRSNLHSALSRKFVGQVQEYQEMQTKYKNKYRDRVGRQLKVVKPDATQGEIDDMMASGNDQGIFSQQLLAERSTQAAKNALADIQDKHKDIMRLEQSIVELHQLFLDMSVLVETQGEMLDQIEYSVQQAHAYVEKGVSQLEKAKSSQKKSRKRMCWLMCCLMIGLIIILGIVFGGLAGTGIV